MTEAQERVLDALRDLTADGWPASVRDVGQRIGASTTTTYSHLQALVRDGLVEQHPRNAKLGFRPVVTDDLSVR